MSKFFQEDERFVAELHIDEAFHKHKVKLEFLTSLVNYLKTFAAALISAGASTNILQEKLGNWVIQFQQDPNTLRLIEELLDRIAKHEIVLLYKIKEDGFYVDLIDSGKFVAPTEKHFSTSELKLLYWMLSVALEGAKLGLEYYSEDGV